MRDLLGQVVQSRSQIILVEQLQNGCNCGCVSLILQATVSPIDMKHAGCMLTHRCKKIDRFIIPYVKKGKNIAKRFPSTKEREKHA